jgi:pyruvate-ferredoxin/flavodoxin oxidoreductase
MSEPRVVAIEGNEAAAHVAYRLSEICAIYPITPSTPMGEMADQWANQHMKNVWGHVPVIAQMQSEAGVAGAIHGAVQSGGLTTTFTASQGLLLMIPNMYKIAGELTPAVFHVAARSLAAQGLSIFGDHQDVMAVRATGFAMLCSCSPQEAHDLAMVSHMATLESRIPFLHFFDGFRTSHEINRVELLSDETIHGLVPDRLVLDHRHRGLSPERPFIRGTSQNPDVYFQARESVNRYYSGLPEIVQQCMDRLGEAAGRSYRLFEYFGHPEAERVIVLMGSGTEAARQTLARMETEGEKVGVLCVRLYRPFSAGHFLAALPDSVRALAVLDRTKEPGSSGEPLYQDVVTCLAEARATGQGRDIAVVGGRYGLSSKEFTPAMVRAVFHELEQEAPHNHFTVGIRDDVTGTSLDFDPDYVIEDDDTYRAMFFGLGADGTVGANKNSIKIIGEEPGIHAQGYFVYDSKKSGSQTVSHLRFGPRPIRSTYLIQSANFIGCHQFSFVETTDVLRNAAEGAVFLLNTTHGPDTVWDALPGTVQQTIIDRKLRLYVIDAYGVAGAAGLGNRINTVMQVAFFALSGVLPKELAIERIKAFIEKSYRRKGESIVKRNFAAVDQSLDALHEVRVPKRPSRRDGLADPVPEAAPQFVREVTGTMIAGRGDELPVSTLPNDGTWPSGTTAWERRAGLPPQRDPRQVLSRVLPGRGAGKFPLGPAPWPGLSRDPLHAAGTCGALHRLHPVRGRLSRQEPGRARGPRDQHGREGPAAGGRAQQPGILPRAAGGGPRPGGFQLGPRRAAPDAPVRIPWRLRRLRRDALPETGLPAVRRPRHRRQRHRLFLHLRRESAHHALGEKLRGSRAGLVKLPVRGQRGIRLRLPVDRGHPARGSGDALARTRRRPGQGSGGEHPRRTPGRGIRHPRTAGAGG